MARNEQQEDVAGALLAVTDGHAREGEIQPSRSARRPPVAEAP